MMREKLEIEVLKTLVEEWRRSPERTLEIIDITATNEEMFKSPNCRRAFEILLSRCRQKKGFDDVLVGHELRSIPGDLRNEILLNPTTGSLDERLITLGAIAMREKIAQGLHGITETANASEGTADAVVTELIDLAESIGFSRQAQTAEDFVQEVLDEVDANAKGGLATIPTGLDAFDKMLGGLQRTLTVIGAWPAVGKSALVAGMACNIARQGIRVGVISLEDEARWLYRRILSQHSGIPVGVIQSKKLTETQQARLQDSANTCMPFLRNILCRDRTPMTPKDVISQIRALIANGCKVVFLDHMGELAIARTQRHDLDLSDALREIRNIAKHARVPLVIIAHLKRGDDDAEPALTDFADTSGYERMARVAIGLWRKPTMPDTLLCSVLKNTNGIANTKFGLRFDRLSATVVDSPLPPETVEQINNLYRDRKP